MKAELLGRLNDKNGMGMVTTWLNDLVRLFEGTGGTGGTGGAASSGTASSGLLRQAKVGLAEFVEAAGKLAAEPVVYLSELPLVGDLGLNGTLRQRIMHVMGRCTAVVS